MRINGQQEPSEDIQLDYNSNHVARVYHRMLSYMGRDQNVDTGLQISQLDFKKLYPIYYFSLEHLDLTRKAVVDIHFRARIVTPAVPNYRAVAVLHSDKSMLLEGVGERMRLIDAPVENLLLKNPIGFSQLDQLNCLLVVGCLDSREDTFRRKH